ncbi:MAG TPA: sulfur relay protein DsrC [Gammaproteobacteria bacterium]|nr:sulfur relay protein DsrC [Gammaproteobacteria bacterium]
MLLLSEVLLQEHHLTSFESLKETIVKRALAGEFSFSPDIKPQFADTPEDWEEQLEIAFSSA